MEGGSNDGSRSGNHANDAKNTGIVRSETGGKEPEEAVAVLLHRAKAIAASSSHPIPQLISVVVVVPGYC